MISRNHTSLLNYTQQFVNYLYKSIADILGLYLRFAKNNRGKKLRILIFNWRDIKHLHAGGAEVYIHEIAKRWIAEGCEVTLFCGNDRYSAATETVEGIFTVRKGGFYSVYLWAFIYYILIFRNKFDVVIESGNGIPFFTPLFSGIPKILILHHVHKDVFHQELSRLKAWIATGIETKIAPMIYTNTPIITVSKSSKSDLEKIGFNREQITIINPGVSDNYKSKVRKSVYPSFIYLGRVRPYKNIDIALLAFKNVVAAYPNARLTIAGWGSDSDFLRHQVASLGLTLKVKLAGLVSEQYKYRLLGKAWVALQPSSYEGWSISVIEANIAGVPVIASDVSGLKDSVKHKMTGLLVPVRNVDSLAREMKYLISHPSTLKKYAREAGKWANMFSWDTSSSEMLAFVKKQLTIPGDIYLRQTSKKYLADSYNAEYPNNISYKDI